MEKALIIAALGQLSRTALAASAKSLGIPVGKSKANTISNLANAIHGVKGARCTIHLVIRRGESSAVSSEVILSQKFRSARDGSVLITPETPKAVLA